MSLKDRPWTSKNIKKNDPRAPPRRAQNSQRVPRQLPGAPPGTPRTLPRAPPEATWSPQRPRTVQRAPSGPNFGRLGHHVGTILAPCSNPSHHIQHHVVLRLLLLLLPLLLSPVPLAPSSSNDSPSCLECKSIVGRGRRQGRSLQIIHNYSLGRKATSVLDLVSTGTESAMRIPERAIACFYVFF